MKTEQKCKKCGVIKSIEEFPTRGNEVDRLGVPRRRSVCSSCEAKRKLDAYHLKKEKIEVFSEYTAPVLVPILSPTPKLVPKINDLDDYTAWEKHGGRPLADEEKEELNSSARELIIAMMELVIKERQ